MATLLVPELVMTEPRPDAIRSGITLAIEGDSVAALGPRDELITRYPDADEIALPGCLVAPGLVNAHQHGRGVSQIQLGFVDTFLEEWIHGRKARGRLDPYPLTRLAAANMLANGVTTTIHANYTYGGDYEEEVRASLRAYDEAGIRVTVCVGAQDRGIVVYPPHETCFLQGLPEHLRDWLGTLARPAYAGGGEATVALMERLLADYAGHPRIRLAYGPAGPQWVSDELMSAMVRHADAKGLGLHLHVMESPAQAAANRELFPEGVFAHLENLGALNERTVLAHAVWVEEPEMHLIAKRRAIVVRNAGCNLRLRNGIAPVPGYLAHGVRVAVGTDNASLADDEDLLKELRLTHLLAREPDWNGRPPPSVSDLLTMAVTNGVAAAGFENLGTLTPGARADLFAIDLSRVREPYLDADMPLAYALLARADGADVRLTMVDGRVVYRDAAHPLLDMTAVNRAAAAVARAACASTDSANAWRAQALCGHVAEHYRRTTR